MPSRSRCARRIIGAATLTLAVLLASASGGAQQPARTPTPPTPAPGSTTDAPWPIKTREHVDLWLHGFAMIADDTAGAAGSPIPLFRHGYHEAMIVEKNKVNAITELDANHDVLAKRLRDNPGLVNAQFLALYFSDWTQLDSALSLFVKIDGDLKQVPAAQVGLITFLRNTFPGREDRDFARRMLNSLRSERETFYHSWWIAETRRRDHALEVADSLWQHEYRPRLQRFMSHSNQTNGQVLLSPALEGEGRTILEGRQRSVIAVGYPATPAQAVETIYALVHELVGPLIGSAVDDNTTPAEKRTGAAARVASLALVRGGALLLAHISPAAADGYERFYLRVAGATVDGDPAAAFAKTFPVAQGIVDSIERQIAISYGGI